jgi:hypothetical protein
MDYEKWSRLSMSDKIREPKEPVREPVREPPVYEWSLSEATEIGASFLALMESQVESNKIET